MADTDEVLLVPLTGLEIDARVRTLARELLEVDRQHAAVCRQIASAEAEYKRKYLTARIGSTVEHPDRTVAEHDAIAEQTAFAEWQVLNGARWERRVLTESAHSIRQILSNLQTTRRALMDEARL